MTEEEWLASADPAAMLSFLTRRNAAPVGHRTVPPYGLVTARKLRLFAAACCRAIQDGAVCQRCQGVGEVVWPGDEAIAGTPLARCADCKGTGRMIGGLSDPRSRRAVEVAERYADGEATQEEFEGAADGAYRAWLRAGRAASPEADRVFPAWAICTSDPSRDFRPGGDLWAILARNGCPRATQAALIRDIFNPFHAVAMRPEWLKWNDSCVRRIAAGTYQDRRWGDLPILGDALLDACCDDEELIRHCRGERVESEGPPILVDFDGCPYCKHWPKNSPYGENGFVKCHRWRGQPSSGREYGEPGAPSLSRCDKCNRVWERGYDEVVVVTRFTQPHARGCHVVDLILGKE